MLGEKWQYQKDIYCTIVFIKHLWNNKYRDGYWLIISSNGGSQYMVIKRQHEEELWWWFIYLGSGWL